MRNREINRQLQILRSLIVNTKRISDGDPEIQGLWAKHICVLCIGLLENAIKEIYIEYASQSVSAPIANYIGSNLNRIRTPKMQTFLDIAGSFKDEWKQELEEFAQINEGGEAINSLIRQRHLIAHGKHFESNISLAQVENYFARALEVLEKIEEQCAR